MQVESHMQKLFQPFRETQRLLLISIQKAQLENIRLKLSKVATQVRFSMRLIGAVELLRCRRGSWK